MLFILIIYVTCVLLPIGFWSLVVYREDESELEPLRLLVIATCLGMGAGIISVFIESPLSHLLGIYAKNSANSFFIMQGGLMPAIAFLAGPIEELSKLFLWTEVIYGKKEFNQVRDGVVYAIMCALGFAFLENSLYFINMLGPSGDFGYVFVGVMRAIVSTLIHVAAGAVVGLYVGRSKFMPGNKFRMVAFGIIAAALLHGFCNMMLIYLGLTGIGLCFGVSLVSLLWVFKQIRKPENTYIYLVPDRV